MPLPPVDPNHRKNVRDDDYRDFNKLKAGGQVRNKLGFVIGIDDPHFAFSARQRDELYQAYCEFAIHGRTDKQLRQWIATNAKKAGMSVSRATRIIGQGSGEWKSPNSKWWRGVSVS